MITKVVAEGNMTDQADKNLNATGATIVKAAAAAIMAAFANLF